MQDCSQEIRIQQAIPPAAYSSVKAGDYINMENYAKMTVVVETGTIGVGSKVAIRKAKNASGGSATALATPFVGNKYYKNYTLTSATSSSSVHYMNIANSDDSKTLIATIDPTQLSASYPFLHVYVADSTASSAILGATYLLWGARYAGDPPADPTS